MKLLMFKDYINSSLEETKKLAQLITERISNGSILLLNGDLGSGKTQFVRFIAEHLEVLDIVTSPSFLILNKYSTEKNMDMFHFDFYRVKNIQELEDLGFFEIIESNEGIVLIEWADLYRNLFDGKEKRIIDIYFNFIEDNINQREIVVKGNI